MQKKMISIIIVITLFFSILITNQVNIVFAKNYGLSSPRVSNNVSTWDCVWFGNYYKKNNRTKEPIKWRVLNVNGNDAFLMADQIVKVLPFNEQLKDVYWEKCTLRSWLNGYSGDYNIEKIDYRNMSFLGQAFDSDERNAIKTTTVKDNKGYYGEDGGNVTYDKIYLLSYKEVINTNYGFDKNAIDPTNSGYEGLYVDKTRYASCTEYAKQGQEYYRGWWLRSPGIEPTREGCGDRMRWAQEGWYVNKEDTGVRPVLHLNLDSDTWSYAGTVNSAGEMTENDYSTSKTSVLGNSYSFLLNDLSRSLFPNNKYFNTIRDDMDIIIPGLEQTNQISSACHNMVPQGVCATDKYVLITAYDSSENESIKPQYKHKKHNSVIYVMNRKTCAYIKTIVLNNKGHVGAIAWNPKDDIIYIAGTGNQVMMTSVSDIENAGNEDANKLDIPNSKKITVDYHPSFLTYCGGYLFIGNMPDSKTGKNIKMIKCDKNCKRIDGSYETSMPNSTNGVSFQQGTDGKDYMMASINNGRKEASILNCYKTSINSCVTKYENPKDKFYLPSMSEDIDIRGNLVYTCFESAANYYRKAFDGGSNSVLAIDRIMVSNAQKITGVKTNPKSQLGKSGVGDEGTELLDNGKCGQLSTYSYYDDGTLVITDFGDMEDYSSATETPWNSYASEINNVVIGADISSVGENAFSNLPNLNTVTFSKMMNDQSVFRIKNNSFKNCANLELVNMPDVAFDISSSAFDGCNKLQVRTDSSSVTNFCQLNDISIHNHNYKYQKTVAPTCLEDGYDLYKCDCGEEDLRNTKLATDKHSYKVTSTYGNTKLYTCEHCGSKYEVVENPSNNNTKKTVVNKKPTSIKKIKAKKKALKVIWKKVSGVNGYQINYSLKKNFKKAKTINIKKVSTTAKTIKKLKRKKKYYLRMRTYLFNSGEKIYSVWSKAKVKKTK